MQPFLGTVLCLMVVAVPASATNGQTAPESGRSVRIQLYVPAGIPPVPIDDPHDTACEDCHLPTDEENDTGPLRFGDDTISLCLQCHPAINLHPVGVPAGAPHGGGDVTLPLGSGALDGRLTCLTCHYGHADEFRRHLLRGDSGEYGSRREKLCAACHMTRLRSVSPHLEGDSSCRYCHMSLPGPTGEVPLGVHDPQLQTICYGCHPDQTVEHCRAINPFADVAIVSSTAINKISLHEGRFTCLSCHDQHGFTEDRQKLLRKTYLDLAAFSRTANPHWKDFLCPSCHEGEPSAGSPKLAYGGEVDFICGRCHSGQGSCGGIHPVNLIPSPQVSVPENMPLREGRLTCVTCHDASLQQVGERDEIRRVANSSFLRLGSTYRSQFCLQCHSVERRSRHNVHRQLDAAGELRKLNCLFCHATLPEPGDTRVNYRLLYDDSLDELCDTCHDGKKERHPEADHLVSPSRRVMASIEETRDTARLEFPLHNGRIVCITCHNPHQEGVIRETDAYRGFAKSGTRQLILRGMETCRGCHPM